MTKHRFVRLAAEDEGYPVHSHHMMQKFGITGQYWPDAGMAPRMIDGIKVWVTPRAEKANKALGVKKSSTHRVLCECPTCGHVLSAGRLFQHSCTRRR